MTRPGSTKMIEDSVPAAEATVCTMLFSWIVAPLKPRSTAMEMTAAGIEVAKVRPALRPKKTLAAVNTTVITTPRTRPRRVNSARGSVLMLVVSPGRVVVTQCRRRAFFGAKPSKVPRDRDIPVLTAARPAPLPGRSSGA